MGAAWLAGGLVLGLAAGVLIGGGLSGTPEPTATPEPGTRGQPTLTDGPLEFEALDAECDLIAVRGDHADWLAEGRYCRIRLAVTNTDRYVHDHDATRLEVYDEAGATYEANLNATQIADQPTVIEIKVGNRLEFDAWFDVPENARIVALGVAGSETRVDLRPFGPHATPPAIESSPT